MRKFCRTFCIVGFDNTKSTTKPLLSRLNGLG
jgi:hypothetical protein